ncbi:aromatic amino acid hydroxylase [Lentimicrobium sp. L6]|uniref:aromatic amino acid hydroxylase n=1 Tax=Lentimicrobium sp. L6 TaxID=2735916 RepID=UPI0015536278|nr:aromatic amino acid hydroxylase [Lentimicrobium sp. L6]NPD84522.1 aromatic amino acid hydroxylase [Lentimicrobium sp. L6]
MKTNPIIESLPEHLKDFIIDQNYQQYTGRSQAVWRYVMRRNLDYLADVAHHSYLDGLKKTGISIDRIPSLEDMNDILSQIGWGAVCVDGFIPPAAFMEFQKHNVLVIAADIRSIDQLEYTPAPDIVHEAAGHAPIIADKEYAEYLRKFGDIGSKAFSSTYDYELYEAIRHLSILKADPNTKAKDIKTAEDAIIELEANPSPPSEMAFIRNLHWWTVEYGLIGSVQDPKIYGAGLLSSIGESVWAMSEKVEKIPYSLEAMDYSFDITKPQPQLFVTPDFNHLNTVLDEFTATMSLKIGGIQGINKAIESKDLATAVLRSGLQVSGVFTNLIAEGAHIVYIQTNGPSMLSYQYKVLEGHGKEYHEHGYGTAVGKLKGALKPMRLLEESDLRNMDIIIGKDCRLEFDSGLKVNGRLMSTTRKNNKLLIMSFEDCTVEYKEQVLFQPDWGIYDMGIGEQIPSVFAGVADAAGYQLKLETPSEVTHKINYSEKEKYLFQLYDQINSFSTSSSRPSDILIDEILRKYPKEWLLQLEALYQIEKGSSSEKKLLESLNNGDYSDEESKLIELGLT